MNYEKEFDDARRMLVELLAKSDDGPVIGVDKLSEEEKLFLVSTCSAKMIEVAICKVAGFRTNVALEGLEALMVSAREHIRKNCARVA
jgi:hypothetical protein